MSKNHSKCGDKIGYGRFKLRLPVLRLGFWPWAFHSRSGMTRAFIWHQKVKIANLQLSNVMLKDREPLLTQHLTFHLLCCSQPPPDPCPSFTDKATAGICAGGFAWKGPIWSIKLFAFLSSPWWYQGCSHFYYQTACNDPFLWHWVCGGCLSYKSFISIFHTFIFQGCIQIKSFEALPVDGY